MDDITKEFLVESYESLDQLDSDFVALEETPGDRDRLASIFRTVHTIKGTSGFLAFPTLERVAHVGENLLVPLRDGELMLDHDIADALLGMVDAIRSILCNIESTGGEGDADFAGLIGRLESLLNAGGAETAQDEPPAEDSAATETVDAEVEPETAEAPADNVVAEPVVEVETTVAPKPEPAPTKKTTSSTKAPAGGEETENNSNLADSTVRINVKLLDQLMNQVGELVLARNQILQFSNSREDAAMVAASQRLNLITTELQEGVMKTRMQPIRNAWSKLPRVVRDLSSSCAKKVEVVMEGAETELDKTILEAIKDPLTHIVRNSVDHGIESPEVRKANGKPETGTLLLRAYHESGQVNIEITDDGGGISSDRIKVKALEKGLVSEDEIEQMSEHELTNLILLPGFSTAEKVTNVSGRGVGMDVVKTNIERIGGTLEIQSKQGHGTTLRIKIPLTLAIVPALIISTGQENYAIPQVSLLELVRLDGTRAQDAIEFIHDAPVYRLRGNLLPLVYLDEQLNLRAKRDWHTLDETINIVVLQAEDRQFGLVVDSINDTQEIVVKPLGKHLKNIDIYAGSTIMGDGTVALILDTIGLARQSNVLTQNRERELGDRRTEQDGHKSDVASILILDPGDGTRAAVPLSSVARLEEFELSAIENSNGGQVVQYRNDILPLVSLSGSLCPGADGESTRVQTVVVNVHGAAVGVMVHRIEDIVQIDSATVENESARTVIIQDRVTEVLNLREWVVNNYPHLIAEAVG